MSKKQLDPRIVAVCQRLKQIRIDRGYKSYEHFALEHCDQLGRMSVWRVEQGCNLTLQTLLKYLDIHNITMEEFFLNSTNKPYHETNEPTTT